MSVLLCGIDEAGYGPLLGPLCVGMTAFRVEGWEPGDAAPDLWKSLGAAVCRKPGDKAGRIAVEDSKKLKGPNDSETRHPLLHLERGVLSFMAGMGVRPATDAELFDAVRARVESHPWYEGQARACPVASGSDQIGIAANLLRRAMAAGEVEALDLRCRVVGEAAFNDVLERTGTKAAAVGIAIADHLRSVWDRWAADEANPPGGPRVVCDRQGGRIEYAGFLGKVFPRAAVTVQEQTARRSRYEVVGRGRAFGAVEVGESGGGSGGGVGGATDDRARTLTVLFMPEAESAHLPVALASMLAKYIRELMMGRFNRHWCSLMPELKPTAGYTQDARRWLAEAKGVLTAEQRRVMIRRA